MPKTISDLKPETVMDALATELQRRQAALKELRAWLAKHRPTGCSAADRPTLFALRKEFDRLVTALGTSPDARMSGQIGIPLIAVLYDGLDALIRAAARDVEGIQREQAEAAQEARRSATYARIQELEGKRAELLSKGKLLPQTLEEDIKTARIALRLAGGAV